MLFAPLTSGFVLWYLVYWLFKDDMDWRACVIWSAVSELVGCLFAFFALKLIIQPSPQFEDESKFIWSISPTETAIVAISGLIGTMLTIYGVIWYRQGRIPLGKAIILFLGVSASWMISVFMFPLV
jgi:hypothetical protein